MKLITVVLLSIFLFSCKQSEITTSPDIKQRENRHIGFHVTMPQSLEYNECFLLAKNAGMSIIPMTFGWNAIEPDKSLYDSTLPVISQLYYPAQNISLCLTITPIYAIGRGVPKDLMNTAWNSPVMIARFSEYLTRLRTTMPSVSISYIILGNEINLGLKSDQEWKEYKQFVVEARKKVKELWGASTPVGVEATLYSALAEHKAHMIDMNLITDFVAVSYYPLNSDFTMKSSSEAVSELNQFVSLYPNRNIVMEETGYASSSVCNSSEKQQADYITALFSWWDKNSTQVPFIGLLWLHDLSQQQTDAFAKDYGITNVPAFKEYVRTLGLRTYSGTGVDKTAITTLKNELQKRGW